MEPLREPHAISQGKANTQQAFNSGVPRLEGSPLTPQQRRIQSMPPSSTQYQFQQAKFPQPNGIVNLQYNNSTMAMRQQQLTYENPRRVLTTTRIETMEIIESFKSLDLSKSQ